MLHLFDILESFPELKDLAGKGKLRMESRREYIIYPYKRKGGPWFYTDPLWGDKEMASSMTRGSVGNLLVSDVRVILNPPDSGKRKVMSTGVGILLILTR